MHRVIIYNIENKSTLIKLEKKERNHYSKTLITPKALFELNVMRPLSA